MKSISKKIRSIALLIWATALFGCGGGGEILVESKAPQTFSVSGVDFGNSTFYKGTQQQLVCGLEVVALEPIILESVTAKVAGTGSLAGLSDLSLRGQSGLTLATQNGQLRSWGNTLLLSGGYPVGVNIKETFWINLSVSSAFTETFLQIEIPEGGITARTKSGQLSVGPQVKILCSKFDLALPAKIEFSEFQPDSVTVGSNLTGVELMKWSMTARNAPIQVQRVTFFTLGKYYADPGKNFSNNFLATASSQLSGYNTWVSGELKFTGLNLRLNEGETLDLRILADTTPIGVFEAGQNTRMAIGMIEYVNTITGELTVLENPEVYSPELRLK